MECLSDDLLSRLQLLSPDQLTVLSQNPTMCCTVYTDNTQVWKIYDTEKLKKQKRYRNENGAMAAFSLYDQVENEIRVLETLNHCNCVPLNAVAHYPNGIVTLRFPLGEPLMKPQTASPIELGYCSDRGPYSAEDAVTVAQHISAGLRRMHALSIAHRDVKPENILRMRNAKNNFTYVISDFGSSKFVPANALIKDSPATLAFFPPEICALASGAQYNAFKADLWALGLVVWIMVCGKLPYTATDIIGLLSEIETFDVTAEELTGLRGTTLELVLQNLLNKDPTLREYQELAGPGGHSTAAHNY